MQYFPLFLVIIVGMVFLARPITVLLHEFGHAIPALLLTRKKVTVYVGSYGDPKRSLKLNLGVMVIYFRYNPFAWRQGVCIPSANTISVNKQIIYVLAGPLASLLIGIAAAYISFAYDLHGSLKLFLIVFLGSAFLDLLMNIIPYPVPIKLHDGTITYNDGYQLQQLIQYKRLPKEYTEAAEHYNRQRYADAAILFEKMLTRKKNKDIYRLAIYSYLQVKNYVKSRELLDQLMHTGKMNENDFCTMGHLYSELGFHEKALEFYNLALQKDARHWYSLNNKGYTLNLMERYEEAIPLFDKAIEVNKKSAYSFNNRGHAKIKLGETEEGLKDINISIKLDPNNSYAYRNLGIYHFDREEYSKAQQLFLKAKELDSNTHMINELIRNVETKLTVDQ